jgi:hypothetical protein
MSLQLVLILYGEGDGFLACEPGPRMTALRPQNSTLEFARAFPVSHTLYNNTERVKTMHYL